MKLFKIRNAHIENPSPSELKVLKREVITESKTTPTIMPYSTKAYYELTSARNRNLIYPDEQIELRKKTVGFFGMSVGSHAALTWVMQIRPYYIKISDPDVVDATNLNRLRFPWSAVDKYKVDVVKKKIQAMHPLIRVTISKKTDTKSIKAIFFGKPKLDAVVDEIDNFEHKILLRKFARELGIPLVSSVDVGNNVFVDVERYDLDPKTQMFLGRVENPENIDFTLLDEQERKKFIIQLVGLDNNSERMLNSLFAINANVPTWPQLGATASIAGGIVTTILTKILTGSLLRSSRYYVMLDDIFGSDDDQELTQKKKATLLQHIT